MNNCRAGLYSFVSTETWLRESGMASPPALVVLGLTLPNSRILCGIAGIGLTLPNIAIILPYLRQPILDSIHAREYELHEPSIQEQTELSSEEINATGPVDPKMESPAYVLASPCDREHQNTPLTCSATIKSICSAITEYVDPKVTSAPLPANKTNDDQIPPEIYRSPDVDSTEKLVSVNHLLMSQGRSALQIPLPIPDEAEIAFFDTTDTLSNSDPDLVKVAAVCEQSEGDSIRETDGLIVRKLVTADLPNASGCAEIGEHIVDVAMPIADGNVASTIMEDTVTVRGLHNPVQGYSTSHLMDGLSTRRGALQGARIGHSMAGGKDFASWRPGSLEFIPQSVIRRYPSAPMISARRCFGRRDRALSSGHDHPFTPVLPDTLVHNLPGGPTTRTSYTASEGRWSAAFLTAVDPNTRSMEGKALVIKTVPAQDPLIINPASLPESLTVHEATPLERYSTRKGGLGVLARAALRNRRSAARQRRNDGIDSSSSSGSDSDCDSDSQYSSGSSADESMLPHILGADLIAAIDANSESELNLAGRRKPFLTPHDIYEDLMISEGSAADLSMIMHVSSNDDTSDGEAKSPVALRSRTYEDIQQWASGVVQRCVRQVCRNRTPAEPSLSPSQASDVCAERPSGSGISQCPLSGLHCKLGAQVPTPRTKELPASLPPTSIQPSRKPLSVRNVRDIPEFIPGQRYVPVIAGQVERPWSTRRTTNATRDAATQVIAKMENQAGRNTRQWLVGMEKTRRVDTIRDSRMPRA